MTQHSPRPYVCLAASGGGHLQQLLDMGALWRDLPHFFVTEDTALGRSVAERYETDFVPHFALGQARLGAGLQMLRGAWHGLWQSLAIVRRRRPDVVISTGAGSMVFVLLWARMLGARIVLIDSIARFERPSAFARLARPLAHKCYAQSAESALHWGGAEAYDPFHQLDGPPPEKDHLLLATVGATLPFPRLVRMVSEAKAAGIITEEVVLQTGQNGAETGLNGAETGLNVPDLRVVESLPFAELQALLRRASVVVCHGGTGSIITALQHYCRTIVVPRRHTLGEHYDEHQAEITNSLVKRGIVVEAHDAASLARALDWARSTPPTGYATDYSELIASLREWLAQSALNVRQQ